MKIGGCRNLLRRQTRAPQKTTSPYGMLHDSHHRKRAPACISHRLTPHTCKQQTLLVEHLIQILIALNDHHTLHIGRPSQSWRYFSQICRVSLLQERIAGDLVLADLVLFLIDLPGLQVLLHPILLALQMVLIATACPPAPITPQGGHSPLTSNRSNQLTGPDLRLRQLDFS
jgi:hypothetical protein